MTLANYDQAVGRYHIQHALLYNLGRIGYNTDSDSKVGYRTVRQLLRDMLRQYQFRIPPEDDDVLARKFCCCFGFLIESSKQKRMTD